MKKLAVVVREPHRQYESLRTSLGCLLEDHQVSFVVLDHEIAQDEAFTDNMSFLDEMEGRRYSNHPANVERHGFTPLTLAQVGELLREQDVVIPF